MLERFKVAYAEAKVGRIPSMDGDSFTFDGHEFVVNYAKYLIEYLDSAFEKEEAHGG